MTVLEAAESMNEAAARITAWAKAFGVLGVPEAQAFQTAMTREATRLRNDAAQVLSGGGEQPEAGDKAHPQEKQECSVKCKGRMVADLVNLEVKSNKNNDGREASVDLDISIKQDAAKESFGDDFATLAFATMQTVDGPNDTGDSIVFLVDSIKPGQRVVFEKHRIELEEQVFDAQPRMLAIRTVKGEARVVARVRIPIDVGRDKLLSVLAGKVGTTVKINFDPQQPGFDFKPRAADAEQIAQEAVH
jgi:hypothetical protein